jgi:NOL1/NOP2/sun family putative RNA methylase
MIKHHKIEHSLPETFLNRMEGLLGVEFGDFYASLLQPAMVGLRVNTLKLSTSQFLRCSQFQLSPIPWCSSGFTVDPRSEQSGLITPGKHPHHVAGLYYLQEPSAMAAAEILAPQPGEKVLDLCAAPGGKATHLAAMMENKGLLVANEIHPQRVWDLAENLERCGVTNAVVSNETPQRLADFFPEFFDRILVDAPCSGEGMFRKAEVACKEWNPQLVLSCAIRQLSILQQAARMVKPGGHLAYTTCTFAAEENEGVLAEFLNCHPEYELLSIPPTPGFQPARPEWIGLFPDHKLSRAIRIWPHFANAEGHFIALFVKQDSSSQQWMQRQTIKVLPSFQHKRTGSLKAIPHCIDQFIMENLNLQLDDSRLVIKGSYVYYLPEKSLDFSSLRMIHTGWWLGSIRKGRFTPSHALAMGITTAQVKLTLPLSCDDPRLQSYLAGVSIPDKSVDGWILITLDGFPIGWGKRLQGQIKNYYPRGLRLPA